MIQPRNSMLPRRIFDLSVLGKQPRLPVPLSMTADIHCVDFPLDDTDLDSSDMYDPRCQQRLPTWYAGPGDVGDGSFPGSAPITLNVSCVDTSSGDSVIHPVTVDADWTVHTGHQLELERIASAFSGVQLYCVTLVNKIIPALRHWRQCNLRLYGVPMSAMSGKQPHWHVADGWPTCRLCATLHWPDVPQAMEHQRSLSHWASLLGCGAMEASMVWYDMVESCGRPANLPPDPSASEETMFDILGSTIAIEGQCAPAGFTILGFTSADANLLWSAGVHPAWLAQAFKRFGVNADTDPDVLIGLAIDDTTAVLDSAAHPLGCGHTLADAQGWSL